MFAGNAGVSRKKFSVPSDLSAQIIAAEMCVVGDESKKQQPHPMTRCGSRKFKQDAVRALVEAQAELVPLEEPWVVPLAALSEHL